MRNLSLQMRKHTAEAGVELIREGLLNADDFSLLSGSGGMR